MPNTAVKKETEQKRSFSYRCFVGKQFTKPTKFDTITSDYHLERAENDEVIIVRDRNIDWVEKSLVDVPNVGLANVLKLAAKGQINLQSCAFKDTEAGDISSLDPMDVNGIQAAVKSENKNVKKLESIAKTLNCSVDDLVKSLMDGTFTDLVSKTVETDKKTEGGND